MDKAACAHCGQGWLRCGKVLDPASQQQWLRGPRVEDPAVPNGQKYGYGIARQRFGPQAAMYCHGGELPGFGLLHRGSRIR
ncbi:hypothetical protein ACWGLF_15505 [Streptomyces puniciscabiei]